MKNIPLWVVLLLSGCMRSPGSYPSRQDEDTSIKFPNFYERYAVTLDQQNQPFELDGVTLRALRVAANDFLPPDGKERPCIMTQEAHRYRVIRQGDIIFVDVYSDPEACGRKFLALDWGVKYAISTDGRILRRLFAGEPEDHLGLDVSDLGDGGVKGTLVPASEVGKTYSPGTPPAIPSSWLDAGTYYPRPETPPAPDAGSPPLDAGSPLLDAGSPLPEAGLPDGGTPAPDAGTPPAPSAPDAG